MRPFDLTDSDLQHHMFNMTLGDKLFLAPVTKNLRHCLDIGTGTGIWAVDFGEPRQLDPRGAAANHRA